MGLFYICCIISLLKIQSAIMFTSGPTKGEQ
nr:MAG TPA: hypothetical protein [Caudoviricetes sp.]